MIVIGADPGKLSGYVMVSVEDNGEMVVTHWAELTPPEFYRTTFEAIRSGMVDMVVCEVFRPRGGAIAFQPYSLELIGWLKGLCILRGVRMTFQETMVKNHLHEEAVRRFPLVGRGAKGHARDALAHVIHYVQTCTKNVNEGREQC